MAGLSFNGPSSPIVRRAGWLVAALAVVVLIALGASATPMEGDSPERIRNINEQLKCLKCVGESVASAQSEFSREIREDVERQVRAGKTDDEIFTALVNSYGDRVLLNPRASGVAAVVWVLPVLVIGGGIAGLGVAFATAKSRREASTALQVSDADAARVEAALVARGSHGNADTDAVAHTDADAESDA
ncbi:MAG: cytochrome c-type biogenesis protein CcmH [Actinobacteria bacterium]|nr:cytochrome c-type biogenesis protein CcmH [Actinomycetota bacterium]